jgi:hypothetical protein
VKKLMPRGKKMPPKGSANPSSDEKEFAYLKYPSSPRLKPSPQTSQKRRPPGILRGRKEINALTVPENPRCQAALITGVDSIIPFRVLSRPPSRKFTRIEAVRRMTRIGFHQA